MYHDSNYNNYNYYNYDYSGFAELYIQLEGCQYWLDWREGQYIILRAEYFPILPDHSKCKNLFII